MPSYSGGNTRITAFIDPFPIHVTEGEGCRVKDADGRWFYDCITNFTAMIHGYAQPNRAGLIPARKGQLEAMTETAHAARTLVIFDEVISFPLGHSGTKGLCGIRPDLTAPGKIIGGGIPIGAAAGRAEVMAVFDPTRGTPALPHGGTFTANPITVRAGLATMQALTPEAFAHLDDLGTILRDGTNDALARPGLPGACVELGSLFKVHFTAGPITDYRSVYPGKVEKARLEAFHRGLLNRGVLSASYGLALSTPMTRADAGKILAAIEDTLSDIARAA